MKNHVPVHGTSSTIGKPPDRHLWIWSLLIILVLQTTSSFLLKVLPVLAPVFAEKLDLSDSAIGYLVAISTGGSIFFLMTGASLFRRFGPIRIVQIGLILGVAGLGLFLVPFFLAPILAAFIVGLAYGPAVPAGADILHRFAPRRHHALVFSIKQSGVSIAGILCGIVMPVIALQYGFTAAIATTAILVLAVVAAVQPLRAAIDGQIISRPPPGEGDAPRQNLRPLRALRSSPRLWRLGLAGGCLAFNQGCWNAFLVVFLVFKLEVPLAVAGTLYAAMEAGSAFGRLGLGVFADRLSGLTIMRFCAGGSMLFTILLAILDPSLPYWQMGAFLIVGGLIVGGWNGVHLSQIALLCDQDKVGEVSSGAAILIYCGLVAGPLVMAGLISLTGEYDVSFACIAVLPLIAFFNLVRMKRT